MVDTESKTSESDASDTDPADSQLEEESEDQPEIEHKLQGRKPRRLQLSISLRNLVIAVVIATLVGAVGVLAWLYIGAQHKVDDLARQSENKAHAESIALHYAVEAAAMNYEDLDAWKAKLVAGTSPELNEKLTKAATSMEQILVPLQWNSTARPLAAKVRSVIGGTYVVDSFVSVRTKTAQAPEPLQSTATYSVTIDSSKDWQITDVGGVGDALGEK
jgi:Mce-associated membrane protein